MIWIKNWKEILIFSLWICLLLVGLNVLHILLPDLEKGLVWIAAILLFIILSILFYYQKKIEQKNIEVPNLPNLGGDLEAHIEVSNPILSKRELEVLKAMAEGYTNQEIADKLFISLSTVKTHVKNIFEKIEVQNRVQAISYAQGKGWI